MELDDAYANAAYIPGAEQFPPRWEKQAEAFRQSLGSRAETGISYGDHEREKFDLFLPPENPRGVVVFVHGGYWLKFDRSYWSHLAAGPLGLGWAVAMPSYVLCPEAAMQDIARQVARAIEAVASRVDGIPEAVVEGDTALLTAPGDVEGSCRLLVVQCASRH